MLPPPRYRLWWLQDGTYGFNDIPEPTQVDDVYVTDFSGRENDNRVPGYDQELDILAPGSWVRGPFSGYPAYNHLPWWAPGREWIKASPNLAQAVLRGGQEEAFEARVRLMLPAVRYEEGWFYLPNQLRDENSANRFL